MVASNRNAISHISTGSLRICRKGCVMRGTIADIIDSGSIVRLLCLSDGDPSLFTVDFERRYFSRFAEAVVAEGKSLKGLEIEYDDDTKVINIAE